MLTIKNVLKINCAQLKNKFPNLIWTFPLVCWCLDLGSSDQPINSNDQYQYQYQYQSAAR